MTAVRSFCLRNLNRVFLLSFYQETFRSSPTDLSFGESTVSIFPSGDMSLELHTKFIHKLNV
jgi:hypothetical protein